MSTEKRSKIKNISTLDDLLQMTSSILKNSGANDTKRINNTSLSCQFNVTGIGIFTNFYYHTLEHLTKSSNQFSIILEAMQKASREKKYSKLFIVSSNNITNGFKTRINNQFSTFEIDFWTISDLVQIVDERYSNFWSHNDQSLLNYEEDFKNKLDEVNDIRKLVAYKSSHEKLLNIFVKPKLYLKTKDKQSNKASFKKQLLSDLNSYKGLTLINGEAGSGKTRALKELALSFIEENTSESNKKILPLFVYATNLNDYREANGNVILEKYITTTLKNDFDGLSFDDLLNKYEIVFLLDTIDEFDENIQKELYTQFEILLEKKVKIYLGTRYLTSDTILLSDVIKINELHLGKFDLKQVEKIYVPIWKYRVECLSWM